MTKQEEQSSDEPVGAASWGGSAALPPLALALPHPHLRRASFDGSEDPFELVWGSQFPHPLPLLLPLLLPGHRNLNSPERGRESWLSFSFPSPSTCCRSSFPVSLPFLLPLPPPHLRRCRR